MAEQVGNFSDYIRRPEGTYDPWAAGISGFLGGFQMGGDMAARAKERKFAEEQRSEQRDTWGRQKRIREGVAEVYADFADTMPADAPLGTGPAVTAPDPLAAVREVGDMVAPQSPRGTSTGIPLNGQGMYRPGMAPAPAAGLPTMPTEPAPAAPVSAVRPPMAPPAAGPRDPAQAMAQLRVNAPKMMRDAALREFLVAGVYLKEGEHESGLAARERALNSYQKYATVGANEFLAAARSGDMRAVDTFKAKYPDLYDGLFAGEYIGPRTETGPSGVPETKYAFQLPDGKVRVMSDMEMEQFAKSQIGDQEELQNSMRFSLDRRSKEVQEAQMARQLGETESQNRVQNKQVDRQQTEVERRNKADEAIRIAALMQQKRAASSGDYGGYLKATSNRIAALDNAKTKYLSFLIPPADEGGGVSAQFTVAGTGMQPIPFNAVMGNRTKENPLGFGITNTDIESTASSLHRSFVHLGTDASAAEAAELAGAITLLQKGAGANAQVQVGDTPVKIPPTITGSDRYVRISAIKGPNGPIPVAVWVPRVSNDPRILADENIWKQSAANGNYVPLRPNDAAALTRSRFGAGALDGYGAFNPPQYGLPQE